MFFCHGIESGKIRALKRFYYKISALFQYPAGKHKGLFIQFNDAGLVVALVTGELGSRIADHYIDDTEHGSHLLLHLGIIEISFDGLHPVEGCDGVEIDADNPGTGERPLYLEPAPGSCPKVDDIVIGTDDGKFMLDLEQLF